MSTPKEDLKNLQALYLADAHARVAYQKTLARIVPQVQDKSRDAQLVEELSSGLWSVRLKPNPSVLPWRMLAKRLHLVPLLPLQRKRRTDPAMMTLMTPTRRARLRNAMRFSQSAKSSCREEK
jgi:hypothetical protein